jgi:hypothetical protein
MVTPAVPISIFLLFLKPKWKKIPLKKHRMEVNISAFTENPFENLIFDIR